MQYRPCRDQLVVVFPRLPYPLISTKPTSLAPQSHSGKLKSRRFLVDSCRLSLRVGGIRGSYGLENRRLSFEVDRRNPPQGNPRCEVYFGSYRGGTDVLFGCEESSSGCRKVWAGDRWQSRSGRSMGTGYVGVDIRSTDECPGT